GLRGAASGWDAETRSWRRLRLGERREEGGKRTAGGRSSRSPRLEECSFLEFVERLLELLLGVHHDGPVPGDRLLEGLARDEEEADSVGAGLDDDLVAAVEEHQGAVRRLFRGRGVQPPDRL